MLKRKGESMPPCGTPALIGAMPDESSVKL